MSLQRTALSALALVVALASVQAGAQSTFGDRKFNLTVGSFFETSDTNLRVDGDIDGTDIDVEESLGLDDGETLSRFSADWLITDKHMVSFGYYGLKRNATKRLTGEIVFDDDVYPIDTIVDAELKLNFYEFSYTYWLMQREKNAFGVTGGFVGVSVGASLSAEPQQGGNTTELSGKANTDLPVVLIGASYRHRFGNSLVLIADATFLPEITYDNYTGSSLNLNAALEYEFLGHYGVGVAYDSFGIEFEAEGDRAVGSFEYDIEGPQAYVKFFW